MSERANSKIFKPFVCPVRNGSFVDKVPPESHLQSHDDVQLLNLDSLLESFKDVRDIHENELTRVGAVFDLENIEPFHNDIESCLSGESSNPYSKQSETESRVMDSIFVAGCSNMETRNHPSHRAFTQQGDEKLYACNACGKTFRSKWIMNRHLLSHSNVRPHTCDICDKRFKTKKNLFFHRLLHEDERPRKCEICNQSFKRLEHLKWHKSIIHINKT